MISNWSYIIIRSDCDTFRRQNKNKYIKLISRIVETEVTWLSSAVCNEGGVCVLVDTQDIRRKGENDFSTGNQVSLSAM